MKLEWDWAGNDAVAKGSDLIFRLHEKYVIVKDKRSYRETEYQTFQLQVRKKDTISFKDLGYTFYMYDFNTTVLKSVDRITWTDIDDVVYKAEEILAALDFV